jgi:hypothetical protein
MASQNSQIKTVHLSGGTSLDMPLPKKTRRTRKNQEGGSAPVINLVRGVEQNTVASTSAPIYAINKTNIPELVPPQVTPMPSRVSIFQPIAGTQPQQLQQLQQTQTGGGNEKHIRVELKKHTTPKKIHLNPKKTDAQKQPIKHTTRKVRKVTLGVSSLHRRLTRAKKVREKIKELSYDQLKEKLIKGGFIKATSKAPESVLRQIATDSHIIGSKAL